MPITLTGAGVYQVIGAAAVTWDPATKTTNCLLSAGNLSAANNNNGTGERARTTTSQTTGKYYAEFTFTRSGNAGTQGGIGLVPTAFVLSSNYVGSTATTWGRYSGNGDTFNNGSVIVSGGTAFATGNVICFAVNLTNKLIWWRINGGAWSNSGDPATNTSGVDISALSGAAHIAFDGEAEIGDAYLANFGATGFAQTPPSGYGNW